MRSPHLERARLQGLQPVLQLRSRILAVIRTWFSQQGFAEVETPVRLPTPALELHIDAEPSGSAFLRTSPELHMKRLLAAGYDRIFQIGPCFRKGERGERHNPEYTMLEWYRANADYTDIMSDAESLLRHVEILNLKSEIPRLTVEDLFLKHAGWNPVDHYDAERFEQDLVAKVEPALPRDTPVFVMDYPAPAAALSRRKPGRETVAERFELYINGVEIANAFSELTDPIEQRQRFESWARERKVLGAPVYPLDEDFLAALELGMPPSGGIALGIDRLIMVLVGASSLDAVMAFRE
jgi:elongation factor P--(R)-beta-lysine ligase